MLPALRRGKVKSVKPTGSKAKFMQSAHAKGPAPKGTVPLRVAAALWSRSLYYAKELKYKQMFIFRPRGCPLAGKRKGRPFFGALKLLLLLWESNVSGP